MNKLFDVEDGQEVFGVKSLTKASNKELQLEVLEAAKRTNVNLAEEQKEFGSYAKGTADVLGFKICIENPKGSIRSGVDKDGNEWHSRMKNHYGFFRNSRGKDGDAIDVFLGPNLLSEKIYVIDQVDPKTHEFDEHKVMFGFNSLKEAKEAYLSNYEKGWKGLGSITETTLNKFKS